MLLQKVYQHVNNYINYYDIIILSKYYNINIILLILIIDILIIGPTFWDKYKVINFAF